MKKLWMIAAVILFSTAAFAQDIAGDWNGTLHADGGELRLVLHIYKNPAGGFEATLDSVDQGANGIPVSSVTLENSKLSLDVQAVQGTFEGKVSADASEIPGTWTQGRALDLVFHRGGIAAKPAPKPAQPSDLDGDWVGTLDTGMSKLRLVLHITNTDQGLTATMDSLDQPGAMGLPVTTMTRTESTLKFEMKTIGGSYDGTISKDLSAFDGTWTQRGNSLPLVFKRAKSASELAPRRKNPTPAANLQLAGTRMRCPA